MSAPAERINIFSSIWGTRGLGSHRDYGEERLRSHAYTTAKLLEDLQIFHGGSLQEGDYMRTSVHTHTVANASCGLTERGKLIP